MVASVPVCVVYEEGAVWLGNLPPHIRLFVPLSSPSLCRPVPSVR